MEIENNLYYLIILSIFGFTWYTLLGFGIMLVLYIALSRIIFLSIELKKDISNYIKEKKKKKEKKNGRNLKKRK